jgi:hypothetical protein
MNLHTLIDKLKLVRKKYYFVRTNLFYSNNKLVKKKLPRKIFYNRLTQLCKTMKKFGSDKGAFVGESRHNYTSLYYQLLKKYKGKRICLFEMGIGTTNPSISANMGIKGVPGASLRAWKEFLKKALIFSADIDSSILFEESRIKTYYCDQTNEIEIRNMWAQSDLNIMFDFIIDDGYHNFIANKFFLENSIHKLKSGGIYIIEDIMNHEIVLWRDYVENTPINCDFTIIELPNEFNSRDNNLLLIEKV